MDFKDRFFKTKLKLIDLKLKLKRLGHSFSRIRSWNAEKIRFQIRNAITGFIPFFIQTPLNIKEWKINTPSGILRILFLFSFLCLTFGIASSFYSFTANDAFNSFRYVSNAIKGWGYTFNPPPFEPVSGFTSFLWLLVLHALWKIDLLPPQSANIATYFFSMAQIGLCFLFIRRMNIPQKIRNKSLLLFLAVCIILLTNRTFLTFMTSGTEAALFNFLVLWWTFEATADKKRNPVYLSVCAVLIALCRIEGIIFIPATILFLLYFILTGHSKPKSLIAFFLLGAPWFYYDWLNETYGSFIPLSFSAYYVDLFPASGKDYILSFVLEYALYFWLLVFAFWFCFKFIFKRENGFCLVVLLLLTFSFYIAYYIVIMGGDILEYRPLSFFIPLLALAGVKMIADMFSANIYFFLFPVLAYVLTATAIPFAHRSLTKELETRQETTFLYRPVSQEAGMFAFFSEHFDKAQKRLIYQGIGLRHQEHKVLTEELLRTFPTREQGSQLKKSDNHVFAWYFTGVPAWTLPETIIIDLSGQHNKIIAGSDFKYTDRRLFGHEHIIPNGYIQCFEGGNSISIEPFSRRKNLKIKRSFPISDGKVKGCENFWQSQINSRKARSIHIKTR